MQQIELIPCDTLITETPEQYNHINPYPVKSWFKFSFNRPSGFACPSLFMT